MKKNQKQSVTGRDFEALPNTEKERIFRELDNLTQDQVRAARPLTPEQKREHFQSPRRAGGRPRLKRAATETISVSVEKSLLKEANAFAKAKGMKRSELVSAGLRLAMARSS